MGSISKYAIEIRLAFWHSRVIRSKPRSGSGANFRLRLLRYASLLSRCNVRHMTVFVVLIHVGVWFLTTERKFLKCFAQNAINRSDSELPMNLCVPYNSQKEILLFHQFISVIQLSSSLPFPRKKYTVFHFPNCIETKRERECRSYVSLVFKFLVQFMYQLANYSVWYPRNCKYLGCSVICGTHI